MIYYFYKNKGGEKIRKTIFNEIVCEAFAASL